MSQKNLKRSKKNQQKKYNQRNWKNFKIIRLLRKRTNQQKTMMMVRSLFKIRLTLLMNLHPKKKVNRVVDSGLLIPRMFQSTQMLQLVGLTSWQTLLMKQKRAIVKVKVVLWLIVLTQRCSKSLMGRMKQLKRNMLLQDQYRLKLQRQRHRWKIQLIQNKIKKL